MLLFFTFDADRVVLQALMIKYFASWKASFNALEFVLVIHHKIRAMTKRVHIFLEFRSIDD